MAVDMDSSKGGNVKIPDRMFFKIRDVAEIIGVKPHVLRYWESEFPTFSPDKNRSGQRMYTKKDVQIALEIRGLLHFEKYSIAGARQRLKKKKSNRPKNSGKPVSVLKEVRSELVSILKTLS